MSCHYISRAESNVSWRWTKRVGASAALGVVAILVAAASAAERGQELARLFELGFKKTPTGIQEARQQYDALKRSGGADRRLDYAYAVVLCNQGRYRDALPHLANYLASNAADLHARRVEIWALLQERRYVDALDRTTALCRGLSQLKAPDKDACDAAAEFAGAVCGYLQLVRQGTIKPQVLAASKNQAIKLLGEPYAAAFDAGRSAVADRLAELRTQRDARQQQVAADAQAQQAEAKDKLAENRDKLALKQQSAEASAEQVSDAQRKLQVIQHQLTTLTADRARLGAQIISVQAQLNEIANSTQVIDRRTDPARPTIANGGPVSPADPRFAQASALAITFTALNKQALDMDRKMLSLKAEAQELAVKHDHEAESLDKSEADARKVEKLAKALEKQVRRLEDTKSPARGPAMTAEMTRLSTYLPFPYEEEKKRVLDWFEK